MNRKIYFWKLPSTELAMGERTLIMGVLNVTPDSFSDGGRFSEPERACARAIEMEEQGADLIDLGAESTRPDSKRISAEEEWRRLLPVLKLLRDKLNIPLSLDTYKSEIAERAIQYGVQIFNDPSGLTFDANLAKVAAEQNAGLILNHMRGTPETWGKQPAMTDAMALVSKDLEATVSRARRAGVEKNRIIVDPGLGFGKRKEQNSELIAHLGRLAELDYPILAGPSRKSFLGAAVSGQSGEAETAFATAAAVTAAILYGAHMVRVHDVKEMRAAAQVSDEILRVSAAHQAAKELAEDQQRSAVRPRLRAEGPYQTGERGSPTRPLTPPLAKPAFVPPTVEPVAMRPSGDEAKAFVEEELKASVPVEGEAVESQAAEKPAEETKPTEQAEKPAPTETPKPTEGIGQRPILRRPAADRPAKRDWVGPPRREFRPAADRPSRPFGDRPPRRDDDRPQRPFGDRPPRPFGDRPPRRDDDRPQRSFGDRPRPGGDRPPRPFGDRPPRRDDDRPQRSFGDRPRPGGDRPPRPFGDRPPRRDDDRPQRSFGDRPRPGGDRPPRPFGDRPPRRDDDRPQRPFGDRPRPGGDRPRPFGDRPPRRDGEGGGRPGGDRPGGDRPPRPFGDRPRGDGPPRSGPPRGGPGFGGRPGGGKPPRPFRKRP